MKRALKLLYCVELNPNTCFKYQVTDFAKCTNDGYLLDTDIDGKLYLHGTGVSAVCFGSRGET